MAGPYGGLGPGGFVNSIYAPLQAQAAQQQQARVQTLNSLVGSILGALKAPSPDAYGAAAQDQTAAAGAAANRLAASNPDAQTQAMLQAIGAPQSQQQQVSQHNQTVFGGGSALDQYMGGAVPAGVFAADQAAHQTYMNSLPALVGLAAQRGLGSLDLLASKENAQLGSDKATALQQARSTLAQYLLSSQSNKISQAATLGNLLGALPGSKSQPGLLGNTSPITTLAGTKTSAYLDNLNNEITNRDANTKNSTNRTNAYVAKTNASLTGSSKPKPLTVKEKQSVVSTASTIANGALTGGKDKQGVYHPPLDWNGALNELRNEGIMSDPRSARLAVNTLNRIYKAAGKLTGPPLSPKQKKVANSVFPSPLAGLIGG